jgi:hypothetical protein
MVGHWGSQGVLLGINSIGIWLKRNQHWTGPFGVLIGVVVSIYIYAASKEVGEVTLKFNTVKIAEARVPSIRILDRDNNLITNNVFGCEIIIWNTGHIALGEKSDRVREPLTIALSNNVKIVDAAVQDTRNVAADSIKLERQENRISVIWTQFDPGDAIKIFVIYASDTQSPIEYRGRFVETRFNDLSQFKEEHPGSAVFAAVKYNFERRPYTITSLLLILLIQFTLLFLIFFPAFRRQRWARKAAICILVISSIVLAVTIGFDAFSGGTPFP